MMATHAGIGIPVWLKTLIRLMGYLLTIWDFCHHLLNLQYVSKAKGQMESREQPAVVPDSVHFCHHRLTDSLHFKGDHRLGRFLGIYFLALEVPVKTFHPIIRLSGYHPGCLSSFGSIPFLLELRKKDPLVDGNP